MRNMHSKSSEISPTKAYVKSKHIQSEMRISSRFDQEGNEKIEVGHKTPDILPKASVKIPPLAQIQENRKNSNE